jgi:hypothetical protein
MIFSVGFTPRRAGLLFGRPSGAPGEGSPIKRSSVKENTSAGEETTLVALLRYGDVAYIIRLCRYPGDVAGSSLQIFTHWAPIRIKASASHRLKSGTGQVRHLKTIFLLSIGTSALSFLQF